MIYSLPVVGSVGWHLQVVVHKVFVCRALALYAG